MRDRQAGFTLIELLVGMVLMTVLVLAILAGLEGFTRAHARTSASNEAQGAVRDVAYGIARELRNGANQNASASVLQRADPGDLIFVAPDPTSGAQVRVRYCAGVASGGVTVLWRQSQPWSGSGSPAGTACPDASWPSSRQVGTALVPVPGAAGVTPFSYDGATLAGISRVFITLAVKAGSSSAAPAVLASGVTLRNQNRAPTASFTATPTSGNRVILDGSNSADPDDQTLSFRWKDGAATIGTVETLDHLASSGGTHSFSLTVTDPSGATATSTQSVVLQ